MTFENKLSVTCGVQEVKPGRHNKRQIVGWLAWRGVIALHLGIEGYQVGELAGNF